MALPFMAPTEQKTKNTKTILNAMSRRCPYCSKNGHTWQTCPNNNSKKLGLFRRSLSMGHLSHQNQGLSADKFDTGDGYVSEGLGSGRRQRKGDPMNSDCQAISNNFLASSSMLIELANFDRRQHFISDTRGEIGSSLFDIVEDEDNFDANSKALLPLPESESNHEAYHQMRDGSSGKGSNRGEDDICSNITSPIVSEYYSCTDVESCENNNNGPNEANSRTIYHYKKVILKWIFVISNLMFEILSAIFQQLSSPHNSGYALISVVTSFVASIICISEIIYYCGQEKVTWRRKGKVNWFYYPSPSHKCYGNFKDIVGLVCAILQFIFSTISYIFYHRHVNDPIKISIFSVIFAFGLLCSKFFNDEDKEEGDQMAENMLA